ncbi:DUF6282 family protein [Pigmentiphaga kullae]|uniref:TIM-barrel fold metal-dependent hydrolase n=1 Tax=Pigmentiphaga kullae TaxID=151784 RepID=A0A4Q7NHB1_9BURK|nr:DUF6282 family protein [Pigmentiphaga kullae]RZS84246.1 hypothetical protein EV675_0258 [Pigmentiphaga kullae]
MEQREENTTPVRERCVTSYPARRAYRPGVVHPPKVPGVQGTIDIHCHAHEGQQDALSLAKLASESGMAGILYKTVGPISGEYQPAREMEKVREGLHRWADETGIAPIQCWAGYGITMDNKTPSLEKLQHHLESGVAGIWLPVFNHANTYNKVGGKAIWMDSSADPAAHTPPLPWDEAVKHGHYMIDAQGRLKPFYEDVVRMVADHDVALFFGHATHPEIEALADLIVRLGFKRGVIDHPFSPFVDLSTQQMRDMAAAGIYLNFTYDEISPLLGIDPKRIYDAIRAIGVEQVTLSSDAGEPLFPHSVECMRLIRGYMEAFGLTSAELERICCENPAKVVKLGQWATAG